MPFFPELAQIMGDDTKVTLYLEKHGKRMVGSITFTSADQQMPSLQMEGTPREFEAQLIPCIRKYGKEVDGFRTSIDSTIEKLKAKEIEAKEQAKQDAGRVSISRTTATKNPDAKGAQMTIA
jgi:hypothetical protein